MIDLTELMTDPDFTRPFTVKTRAGSFVKGRFVAVETTTNYEAPLQPASPKEIALLPEGDRSSESIVIYTTTKLNMTRVTASEEGLSDIVVFDGAEYKVVSSAKWDKYGFYKTMAVAIGGV